MVYVVLFCSAVVGVCASEGEPVVSRGGVRSSVEAGARGSTLGGGSGGRAARRASLSVRATRSAGRPLQRAARLPAETTQGHEGLR